MPEMTRLFAEPELASLADDMVNDPDQRLWLLQRWGIQWELDADDPGGLAMQSIVPQFFGDADQSDASQLSGPGQRACSTRWRNRTPPSTAEHFATSRSQSRSALANRPVPEPFPRGRAGWTVRQPVTPPCARRRTLPTG
jgi:hypothetical protein